MSLKKIFKLVCPPILTRAIVQLQHNQICFSGNYSTWQEAYTHATGYDTDHIFKRVRESSLKVISGEAVYERDSVCFYEKAYRWSVLACLLFIATKQNNKLNIVDFGGALGSFYYQHRVFLNSLNELNWSVVEQPHFVECGKKEFQNENLFFFSTLHECIQQKKSDVILLSGVLQYLENPKQLLKEISELGFRYVLVDRTPFIKDARDKLTIQSIPESIYSASYPAWFFSAEQFDNSMRELGYQSICNFDSEVDIGIGEFKGFLFEKIK